MHNSVGLKVLPGTVEPKLQIAHPGYGIMIQCSSAVTPAWYIEDMRFSKGKMIFITKLRALHSGYYTCYGYTMKHGNFKQKSKVLVAGKWLLIRLLFCCCCCLINAIIYPVSYCMLFINER